MEVSGSQNIECGRESMGSSETMHIVTVFSLVSALASV